MEEVEEIEEETRFSKHKISIFVIIVVLILVSLAVVILCNKGMIKG